MTRPLVTRALAATLVFVFIAALTIQGRCARNRREVDQKWREMETKAQALKTEIDGRFPTGSPAAKIKEFLLRQLEYEISDLDGEHWVMVGKAPNRDWRMPCGPWEVGVELTFQEGQLTGTRATHRGVDCL
jgi:hypothetical protein